MAALGRADAALRAGFRTRTADSDSLTALRSGQSTCCLARFQASVTARPAFRVGLPPGGRLVYGLFFVAGQTRRMCIGPRCVRRDSLPSSLGRRPEAPAQAAGVF